MMVMSNSTFTRPGTASSWSKSESRRKENGNTQDSQHEDSVTPEDRGGEERSLDRMPDVRALLASSDELRTPRAVLTGLKDLSATSKNIARLEKMRSKTKSSVEAKDEGKILGYNPLLRKYERPMPPSVARYLAGGRDVIIDRSEGKPSKSSDHEHALRPATSRRDSSSNDRKFLAHDKQLMSPRLAVLSQPKKRRSLDFHLQLVNLRPSSRPIEARDIVRENTKNLEVFSPRIYTKTLQRHAAERQQRVEETYAKAQALKREQWERTIHSFMVKHSKSYVKPQETEIHNRIEMEQKRWLTLVILANFSQSCSEMLIREHHMRERRFGQIVNVRRNVQKVARLFRLRRSENYEHRLHNLKHNSIFSIIRWSFENRMELSPEKTFYRCVARFLLRRHFRSYCSLWNKPAIIIKHLLLQLQHKRRVIGTIKDFKAKVVYCQRMFRNSVIRSQLRKDLVFRLFREHYYNLILKTMNKSLSVLFPSSPIAEIKFIGQEEANKLYHGQQRNNYHRMFPKVPLWIGASLERVCNEFVRLCRDVHSVNVRHSEAWRVMQDLFCFFELPEAVHEHLAAQVYNELLSQARAMWSQFLRELRMTEMKEAQEKYVHEVLQGWDSRALAMYTSIRRDDDQSRSRRPLWPMDLLTENKVGQKFQEWVEAMVQKESQSRGDAPVSPRSSENSRNVLQLANSDSLMGWILYLIRSVEESPVASPRGSFRRSSTFSLQNELVRRNSTARVGMYKKITLEKIVRDKMGRSALNTIARPTK
mmetsp:Transcript_45745/g.143565  ORF Transcript_45745/g.143565 Transcript_45745/m.143565 type:complete len:763 (-) Transcript_45745:23-2311(-)